MKKITKIVSALLSVTIIFSIITVAPFTVSATEQGETTPTYVSYQAKRYSAPSSIFNDTSKSYANVYYDNMKSKESVISGVAIWEAAHIATSPSYSLESGLITKKDMYKLAIFDMLDVTESETFASNLLNIAQDSRISYIFSITKTLCDPKDIKVNELKNFEVNAEYLNYLKESAKVAKALDVVDKISIFADECSNLYDAVNTMASYQAIADMKNGTKEILTAIADDTSNPSDLRQAAFECIDCFNKGYEHILDRIIDGSKPYINATLETIFDNAFDWAWDKLISAIPGGKVVMTSAKGMRVLSNSIFKMDDTCRIYYQFEADVMLENAVRNVMNNAKDDYLQDKNQDKAVAYMRAVEMYKRIVLQGYDYGIEMLTIKASAPATQWFDWLNHDYSECMELIESTENTKSDRQKIYEQFEEWVHSDYINLYCKDYNETINGFNNQQTIKTDSVNLTQIKDINVGDSGYIYDYIQKTCQPENSVEYKKCYFTADNKDIFTIDKLGSFVAESAGQVTLIYDKGEELESSITITVGKKQKDEHHNYYEDFEYDYYANGDVIIKKYIGNSSRVIIPSEVNGHLVTTIASSAFRFSKITEIIIPDSITDIGMFAFEFCDKLTNIYIGEGLSIIGQDAFNYCDSITHIEVNSQNTTYSSINGNLYNKGKNKLILYATGKKDYIFNIPSNITTIGKNAFMDCNNLTEINFPNELLTIEFGAFQNCKNLIGITIPDSVTYLGGGAFFGCKSLTSVKLSNSITSLNGSTFGYCENLTNITIPNGVKIIGESEFEECKNITRITIPDSVTNIGDRAFYKCANLVDVNIPNHVTYLGIAAFSGCKNLTNIVFPESIKVINNWTFEDCSSLTSITIPDNVTEIGSYAFGDCSSLSDVYYLGTEEEWNSIDIGYDNDCLTNATIHFNCTPETIVDEITGISVVVINNAELSVNRLMDSENINNANTVIGNSETLVDLYDISLIKDGATVQPDGTTTVKIPTSNENAKVYRIETDGTATDMNAVYDNGYMVFTTEHFSLYALVVPNDNVIGDVNSDGKISILDATEIQKYIAQLSSLNDEQLAVADVNSDGKISIIDATEIQKYIAQLIPSLG